MVSSSSSSSLLRWTALFLVALACWPVQSLAHNRLPPHLAATAPDGVKVDPEFSWRTRRTGIIPRWTSGFGYWRHYNATELMEWKAGAGNDAAIPKPYTEGWMRKCLRQCQSDDDDNHAADVDGEASADDDLSFELWSAYQPEAQGGWLKGFMSTRSDGNVEHQYTFLKTPFRINKVPVPTAPGWDDSTRVTIVRPGGGTFSGTLWLPTLEEQEKVAEEKKFSRVQFCEMWLGETIRGHMEGRKVGVYLQYDGVTGDLEQLFLMCEVTADASIHSVDDPSLPVKLEKVGPAVHATLPNQPLRLPEEALQEYLKDKVCTARVVHFLDGPGEPETASEYKGTPLPYWAPEESDCYLHLKFDDVYVRVPRRFDASLGDEVFMEIGCRTCDGDIQRLLAYGDRMKGGFHTLAHERWSINDDSRGGGSDGDEAKQA